MDWGAFAGGIGQGLEQGQRIRAQRQAMADAARQRAARADVGQTLLTGAQQPEGGAPQPIPMPGATPLPGPGSGAAPAAPGMTAPPLLQAHPQPAPGPAMQPGQGMQAQPQMQGAPAPSAALSGTANPSPPTPGSGQGPDMQKAMADSQKTLQSIARSIYAANPKKVWKDPGELLDAVEAQVKAMNGLDPMQRIAAQAQIAGSRAQYEYTQNAIRQQEEDRKRAADETKARQFDERLGQQWRIAQNATDTRLKVAAGANAARITAERMREADADKRADMLNQYRYDALQAGLDSKTAIANLNAALKQEGIDTGFAKGIDVAEIGIGKTPSQTPKAKEAPQIKAPKVGIKPPGGEAGGKAPVKVSSPAEAKKLAPGTHYVTPDGQEFTR